MEMKKMCVFASFLVAMGVAHGEETRPDWQSLVGTAVTIPAGTTNVAEAADMEFLNQVKSLTVDGALVLNATTSWINLNFGGSGTVIKRGATAVSQTVAANSFSGTVRLEGGSLERTTWYVANGTRGKVVVKNGATFVSNDAHPSGGLKLELEGTGYQSQGALWLKKTGWGQGVGDITLLGDATIAVDANSSGTEYAFAWYTGGTDAIGNTDGRIVMNGHTLTIGGTASNIGFNHMTFSGGGSLTFEAPVSGMRTVTFASATTLGDLTSVTFPADATLVLNGNEIVTQTTPITALGNLTLTASGTATGFVEDCDNWAGDVSVFDGSTLVLQSVAGTRLTMSGAITGGGSVSIPKANAGEVCLASMENVFAGSLTVDNSGGGTCILLEEGSVPDSTKVSVSGGFLDLPIAETVGGSGWSVSAIDAFKANATLTGGVLVPYDYSRWSMPGPVTVAQLTADPPLSFLGTVSVSEPAAADGKTLGWLMGTVTLSYAGSIALEGLHLYDGNCTVGGVSSPATLVLDGGADVAFGATPLRIGYGTNVKSPLAETARLVVKNAIVRNENAPVVESTSGNEYALVVGGDPSVRLTGVLDVRDGAVVSNKLLVSGWGASAGSGDGRGLVLQGGGRVTSLSGSNASAKNVYFGPGVGIAGHGHYQMDGGSFTAYGSFPIGGYGVGTWAQSDGVAVFTNFPGTVNVYATAFGLAVMNRGYGSLDLTGGTMDFFNEFKMSSGGFDGKAYLSVCGETARFDCHGYVISANGGCANAISVVAVSNGGRLRAASVTQAYPSEADTWLSISFDGGTFVCGANNKDVFGVAANPWQSANAVWVRAGGMTVDTDGKTGCSSSVPFTAATGAGLVEVPLPDETSVFDYQVPPFTYVTGTGGHGAMVLPIWNSRTARVSGFRIVDPGMGYADAKTVIGMNKEAGTGSGHKEIACVVDASANAVSGPFTKVGEGDFTLNAANTWGGKTRVLGGMLRAGVAGAIPADADIVLGGGGCLDFNGLEGSVASVTYVAGGGSIIGAGNVSLPTVSTYEISTAELAAGKSIELVGNVDLSRVTVRITGDPALLSESGRYVVATTTGVFSGSAAVVTDPAFADWTLRGVGGKLKFSKTRGLMLILR